MKVYEFFGPPPEPGIERRLAGKYRGPARVDLRILRAVMHHPQTLSTLQEVLGDHHARRILPAVERLAEDGLLRARLHARRRPSYKTYEPTALGILVARLIE